ncbi:MAG: hypothetical protein V4550_09120 [Gemmatimonadota bacterium]
MPLGTHSRTDQGTFRRERGDSLARNLKEDYPEFSRVPGNTRLDALRDRFGVDSINAVRQELRKLDK